MKRYTVLAFDFGASSGRAILATMEENQLSYREVHRFDNIPLTKKDHESPTMFGTSILYLITSNTEGSLVAITCLYDPERHN